MTLGLFAIQNVPDNADIVRQAISSLVPNGGGVVESGDFTVTQTSTPSMAVLVGVGRAWIDGTSHAHLSGKGYSDQGQYFLINYSSATVPLATSNPTNPRIDVIYVGVQDSVYSGSGNQPVLTVATGTPTAGAAYPANAPSLPTNSIAVAWVSVTAGVSSVSNANITPIPNVVLRNTIGQVASVVSTGANIVGISPNNMLEVNTYVGANRILELKATIDGAGTPGNSPNNMYVGYSLAHGGTGTGGTVVRSSTKAYAISGNGEGFEISARYTTTAAGMMRFNLQAQVSVPNTGAQTMTASSGQSRLTVTDVGTA